MFFPETEILMQWKEPSPFQQSRTGYHILIAAVIISVILVSLAEFTKNSPYSSAFKELGIALGLLSPVLILWGFFARNVVVLKEDRIAYSSGKYAFSSDYKDIELCTVARKKFPSASFRLLTFTVKEQKGFTILPPISSAILPNEADLNSVLQILQDKGVRVIKDPTSAP